MLLGVLSLRAWKSGTKGASLPFTAASAGACLAPRRATQLTGGAGVALMLTGVMGKKYLATGALFPPGVIAGLSLAMSLFYLYNMVAGGNAPGKKSA
jgi:hypothetical protein